MQPRPTHMYTPQPQQFDPRHQGYQMQPRDASMQSPAMYPGSSRSLTSDARFAHGSDPNSGLSYSSPEPSFDLPSNSSQATSKVSNSSTSSSSLQHQAPTSAPDPQASSLQTPIKQQHRRPISHTRQAPSASARNFSKPFAKASPDSGRGPQATDSDQMENLQLTIPRSRYSAAALPTLDNVKEGPNDPFSDRRTGDSDQAPLGLSGQNVTDDSTNYANAMGFWESAKARTEQAELEQALRKERFDVVGNVDMADMEFDSRLDGPFDARSPY